MTMTNDRSPAEIRPSTASIVYDGKTGKIVSTHLVATLEGGKALPTQELERETLLMAKTLGKSGSFKALTVRADELLSDRTQKVDLKKRTLIATKHGRGRAASKTRKPGKKKR